MYKISLLAISFTLAFMNGSLQVYASTCTQQAAPYILDSSAGQTLYTGFDYSPTTLEWVVCGSSTVISGSGTIAYYFIIKYDSYGTQQWAYILDNISGATNVFTYARCLIDSASSQVGIFTPQQNFPIYGGFSYAQTLVVVDSITGSVIKSKVLCQSGNPIYWPDYFYQHSVFQFLSSSSILFYFTIDLTNEQVISVYDMVSDNLASFLYINYVKTPSIQINQIDYSGVHYYQVFYDQRQLNYPYYLMKYNLLTGVFYWQLQGPYYSQMPFPIYTAMASSYNTDVLIEYLALALTQTSDGINRNQIMFQLFEVPSDQTIPPPIIQQIIIQATYSSYYYSPSSMNFETLGKKLNVLLTKSTTDLEMCVMILDFSTSQSVTATKYVISSVTISTPTWTKILSSQNFAFFAQSSLSQTILGSSYQQYDSILFLKNYVNFISCAVQTDISSQFSIIGNTYPAKIPVVPTLSVDTFLQSMYSVISITLTTNTVILTSNLLTSPCSGTNVQSMPVSYQQMSGGTYIVSYATLQVSLNAYTTPKNCGSTIYNTYFTYSAVLATTNTTLPSFISFSDTTFTVFTSDTVNVGIHKIRIICKYQGIILDDSHIWTLTIDQLPTPPYFLSSPINIVMKENQTLNYMFPPIVAYNSLDTVVQVTGKPSFVWQDSTVLVLTPQIGNAGSYYLTVTLYYTQDPSITSTALQINIKVNTASVIKTPTTPTTTTPTNTTAATTPATSNSTSPSTPTSSSDNSSSSNSDTQSSGSTGSISVGKTKGKASSSVFYVPLSAVISSISNKGLMTISFNQAVSVPTNYTQSGVNNNILSLEITPSLDSQVESISYNWTITEFTSRVILLQLVFTNPLSVQDAQIRVTFINYTLIISESSEQAISKLYTISSKVPSQLPSGGTASSIAAAGSLISGGLNAILYGNLALNIIMSGSLSFLWGMINTLQLIVNVPLFNTAFPANAQVGRAYNWISRLFFNIIIRYFLESILQLSLSSMLNMKSLNFDNASDGVSSGLAICLILLIVALPVFILIFINIKMHRLEVPEFKSRFGSLYEGYRTIKRSSALYNLIYVIRRIMFAFMVVFLYNHSVIQIFLYIMFNIFQIVYLWYVWPFENEFQNKLELFNELCIAIVSYCLLLFTQFVPDAQMRYQMGWLLVFITLVNIVTNMGIILKMKISQLIPKIKLFLKNRKLKRDLKANKTIEMTKIQSQPANVKQVRQIVGPFFQSINDESYFDNSFQTNNTVFESSTTKLNFYETQITNNYSKENQVDGNTQIFINNKPDELRVSKFNTFREQRDKINLNQRPLESNRITTEDSMWMEDIDEASKVNITEKDILNEDDIHKNITQSKMETTTNIKWVEILQQQQDATQNDNKFKDKEMNF